MSEIYRVVRAGVLPKEKYKKTKAGQGKLRIFSSPIRAQDASWMKPADIRNCSSEQEFLTWRSKVTEVFRENNKHDQSIIDMTTIDRAFSDIVPQPLPLRKESIGVFKAICDELC